MKSKDFAMLSLLAALAVFVWARDLAWMTAAGDVLPVLASLPVFVWLGAPWQFTVNAFQLSTRALVLVVAGFVLGLVTELNILLALSWTGLLWLWLRARLEASRQFSLRRLIIFPLLAFPWIMLDLQWLGWTFRLSAAWFVGKLFGLLGFTVTQNGTNLLVQGLPISVEAACSGMNTLQSMLIGGSALAFIFLGQQRAYWWNISALVPIAWLANTARIISLVVAALTFGPEFAQGMFHTWGGWLVLMLMFLLCWMLFAWQRKAPTAAAPAA